MIPELAIAMLACARIGAPHTVIFGGFSSEAIKDRVNDAQAKVVVTADGYLWLMGRVDDVINVAGHRFGTMEIESALVSHLQVAEASVVVRPDDLKRQAICAFVTLKSGIEPSAALREELCEHVTKEIGALAKPDDICFTEALPKTRSGKIMRRLLRELASSGCVAGDTTTLEDFSVLEKLRPGSEE
jgi:acetyl-CoA synthetase